MADWHNHHNPQKLPRHAPQPTGQSQGQGLQSLPTHSAVSDPGRGIAGHDVGATGLALANRLRLHDLGGRFVFVGLLGAVRLQGLATLQRPGSLVPVMTSAPTHTAAQQRGPNCWQCRFFGVSYIPATPYVCRAMGFQSKNLPSLEVLRVDGQFCRAFEAKATQPTAAKPIGNP